MQNVTMNTSGELIISPSETSGASDFNFLLDSHIVHHKKLKERLANSNEWIEFEGTHSMEALLNGTGNLEQHFMNTANGNMEGVALRIFNPTTKLWSIYWADNKSGKLDAPMLGSFENNIGNFYGRDNFRGKPVHVKFRWDATNPLKPIWSQAFSADRGKTWEWNWYMYFSKKNIDENTQKNDIPKSIGVIELRNYVLKQGMRDSFISYFEENLIQSQRALKAYPIGQYRVKGYEDNFFWIRGFENMQERSSFLPSFYFGPAWKQHKKIPNSLLANNDNVHLLMPITLQNDSLVSGNSINSSLLIPKTGITVVDFYTANTKLELLKKLFANSFLPLLKKIGINDYTLWVSESEPNDFLQLPVFQDKNLLVMIRHFKNELDYSEATKIIDTKMSEALKSDLQDAITIKNTLILYPTKKTMNQ
ncbi:MAG: hypothetical protein ACR2KX_01810 [Chitinophagaceae bacterium]